ncbi:MAG: hypothetical protein ABI441_16310 [Flavobacterium sp.]
MFKAFKITSIMAVINAAAIGFIFAADLFLADYETGLVLINLIFMGIALLLVWFWITLNQKITTVYRLNKEQCIGLRHWLSIFGCLILLAVVYSIVNVICCYGLILRLRSGTSLLG